MIKRGLIIICIAAFSMSCAVVKEYEQVNIHDPDMALSEKKCDRNLIMAHSYREGASGANGGKTGGGCGCN